MGQAMVLILVNLALTFAMPGISIGGHIGGLAGGIAATYALMRFRMPPSRVRSASRWRRVSASQHPARVRPCPRLRRLSRRREVGNRPHDQRHSVDAGDLDRRSHADRLLVLRLGAPVLGADPHLTSLAGARVDRDHHDGTAADNVRGIGRD